VVAGSRVVGAGFRSLVIQLPIGKAAKAAATANQLNLVMKNLKDILAPRGFLIFLILIGLQKIYKPPPYIGIIWLKIKVFV
jgi:hypothetical protein